MITIPCCRETRCDGRAMRRRQSCLSASAPPTQAFDIQFRSRFWARRRPAASMSTFRPIDGLRVGATVPPSRQGNPIGKPRQPSVSRLWLSPVGDVNEASLWFPPGLAYRFDPGTFTVSAPGTAR